MCNINVMFVFWQRSFSLTLMKLMRVRLKPSCPLKFHNCVMKWGHLTPQQEVKVKGQHVCPFLVGAVMWVSEASRFPSTACPFPGNLSPCFIWAGSMNMWLASREQVGVITANKAKRAWQRLWQEGCAGGRVQFAGNPCHLDRKWRLGWS